MASAEEKKLQALQKSRQLMLDNLSLMKQTQAAHKAEYDAAVDYVNQMESYYSIMSDGEKKAFDARKKMIADYDKIEKKIQSIGKGIDENAKKVDESRKQLEKQAKAFEQLRKQTKGMVSDQSELVKGLEKMNAAFKGTSKTQKEINTGFASLEVSLGNVNKAIGDGKKLHQDELKEIQKYKKAYNDYSTSIADIQRQVAEKNLSEEQAIEIIKKQEEAFNDVAKSLKFTTEEGKKVATEIQGMVTHANEFGNKLQDVNKRAGDLKSGLEEVKNQIGSTVPMAKEMLDVFSKIGKVGFAGAMAGLAATAGKFLNEKGLLKKAIPGIKDRLDIENQFKLKSFDEYQKPLAKLNHNTELQFAREEFGVDQKYAKESFALDQEYEARRHGMEMANRQKEATMTFKSEASMAYFGKALPNLSYAANQLQNAGISADTIANASVSIASNMGVGGKESAKLGADMAVFAKFAGIGAEEAGSITESFKLMDGAAADTAANMMQGVKAMAEQLDLNPGAVMKEMASASEIALEMNINSGKALAKQVSYATSLGVSFSKIAKAGQSMVLNYKDSIKKEMQLSALLGKQVDLSEVRAKFAEGDTTGAMQALQAQGLDPAQMDMFQKQALQEATGMDLGELTKIGKGGGKSADALDAAANKIDTASINAANKHLLAAETTRQVSLDNQKFALQQATAAAEFANQQEKARKEFDIQERQKKESFEIQQRAERQRLENEIAMSRKKQELDLQNEMANLGNTILFELIPALLAFGATGGGNALGDLINMLPGKKGKKGRTKVKTNTNKPSSAQRRNTAMQSRPAPAAGGPASTSPAAPPTRAQQVAQLKAQNPGMTSQQALQQVKAAPAGGAPSGPAAAAPKPTGGGGGGAVPKPAAAPAPKLAAPPAPSAPPAPKIPAAAPINAPKMGFWDKFNPKKFLGKVVTGGGGVLKILGSVAGKVAGPIGSALSGFSMYKDLSAMVAMNEGPLPELYKNVGGSLMSLVGSILGGAVGGAFLGPIGAMLGSTFGSTIFGWLGDLFPGVPTFLGEFLVDTLGLFGKPGSAVAAAPAGGGGAAAGPAAPTPAASTSKASAIVGTGQAVKAAAPPTAAGGGGGAPKSTPAPAGGGPKATTPGATGTSTKGSALAGGMTGMLMGVQLQKIFGPTNSKTQGFIDQAKVDSAKQTAAITLQTKAITDAKGLPTKDTIMQDQLNSLIELMSVAYGGGGKQQVTLLLNGKKVTREINQQNSNNNLTGGEGGGTGGGGTSDIRLKQNIQLIGVSESGINIYTFEYIEQVGLEGTYQGVMAQELIGTEFESALIFDGEYYKVDYSKLDVEFIRIS
jgi:uncharacterized coiled-coil DUF342 family protein